MAFGDKVLTLYDGSIRLDYKNNTHRYYVRERVNYDLPETNPKAWGKIIYPKGTTTLLGDTLEKKGLMTWALGMAMKELFGFYDFIGYDGQQKIGFSKGVGTLRGKDTLSDEELLPIVQSANKAWTKQQKKGADIGSIVHNAVEHYVNANPNIEGVENQPSLFDIAEQYMWNIKETTDINSPEFEQAMIDFEEDVKKAKAAFEQFVKWWDGNKPVLHESENLLYSREYNICGTDDYFITLNGKKILGDLKTSNASIQASAPEGVYYSYFIQLAIYEICRREMGLEPAEDFMINSCRKDGGFSNIFASDLGLTIEELMDWAKAAIVCFRMMEKTKKALVQHANTKEV